MKLEQLKIQKEQELLPFLIEQFPNDSRKKIKALLGSGNIIINGVSTTQFNQKLKPLDKITIRNQKALSKVKDRRLEIIDETDDIIVVNKPAGLLTVSTPKEKEKTLYHMVSDYVKGSNPKNKIFVIHRLDKDTSGILLFAKKEKVKHLYQNNWDSIVKRREYLAIVEGIIEKESGRIRNYLTEGKEGYVHTTSNSKEGKLAITEYRKLKEKNEMTWLEINLITGRKNQIRVHMKEMGHPVLGDKKYQSNKDPFHRLALHAHRLILTDPITKETKEWVAPIPSVLK